MSTASSEFPVSLLLTWSTFAFSFSPQPFSRAIIKRLFPLRYRVRDHLVHDRVHDLALA